MKEVTVDIDQMNIAADTLVTCPNCKRQTFVVTYFNWHDKQSVSTQKCDNCNKEFKLKVPLP